MCETVTLTVASGKQPGSEYHYRVPARVLIGRSAACDLRLPNDELHWDVSRVHCLLEVNPSGAAVRDLGSRNGTYVNEEMVGRRDPSVPPEEAAKVPHPVRALYDGDKLRVGGTVFRVEVHAGGAAGGAGAPESEAAPAR
jgi:pSer/pThr/pTyr-binding forkhead associated (FHA) protein